MRSLRFGLAALAVALSSLAFGAASGGASAGTSVLVCGTMPGYDPDVQAKLLATGRTSTVDLFDCGSGTPTTLQLASYSAVLVYSDAGYADPTALGNELADYADTGGRVVEAAFGFGNFASLALGGRWASDGYSAFTQAFPTSGTTYSLVADLPSSPLLSGVSTFNGGTSNYYESVTLAPGATLVAHWSNGASTPLVAFNTHSVGLNFYPPSSDERGDFWDASTDGATLLANALQLPPPATVGASKLPRIAVCTTKPVYRSGDGSYGSFADVDVDFWNANKTDSSSPYFGSAPAVYVAGYGLMCGLSDVVTYGGDPTRFAQQSYLVTEQGVAAPAGTDAAQAGAYYTYFSPAG